MHAVNGQRFLFSGGLRIQFLRRLEQTNERHLIACGNFGHRAGVNQDVFVILARIGEIRVLMTFVGNRREEHDARRAFGGIILLLRIFDPLIEISFELLQTFGALERFVKTPECENHIGADAREPFVGRTEIFRAMAKSDFVAGDGEIAHDEVELGMPRDNVSLQIAGVLETLGQRAAEHRDVIVLLENELRLGLSAHACEGEDE
jgi:hypothetical protein